MSASSAPPLERLLKRERAITVICLLMLCALAWLYLVTGAGTGMSARAMTSLSLFPHQANATPLAPVPWASSTWVLIIGMWWVMMIAMMAPSATPAILLYAAVYRRASTPPRSQDGLTSTGGFVAGYLLVWLLFSVLASALQWALETAGLVSAMMMGSQSRWLSAGVLIAAGLYQLSPFKHACLSHCRAPASFLSRHWRPHVTGALRLGAIHGAYCVGCCWLLMALLFVGGVMNLAWIAALSLLVLLEKVLAAGRWVGYLAGFVLIVWGAATLAVAP